MKRNVKPLLVFVAMALCSWFIMHRVGAESSPMQTPKDNEELARMHREDQADRHSIDGKDIDWSIVTPRDKARLARTKQLYRENRLQTATDYYHAAMILQHGDAPEDFLLAHEFCVVAIIKGKNDRHTRWLAAASEDRFLMNIGRSQRFGTQYTAEPATAPYRLHKVDENVTDELRRQMSTPTLQEAREREADLNKK